MMRSLAALWSYHLSGPGIAAPVDDVFQLRPLAREQELALALSRPDRLSRRVTEPSSAICRRRVWSVSSLTAA